MQRGRRPGSKPDPMAQLDAAMEQSFEELAASGTGVAPDDVISAPGRQAVSPAPRAPGGPSSSLGDPGRKTLPGRVPVARRAADRGRDASGRFVPTADGDEDESVDALSVLTDGDEETAAPAQRQSRRQAAPILDDDDDEDDVLDDEDDDDDQVSILDYDADEVEGDEDDTSDTALGPEGSVEDEAEAPRRSGKDKKGQTRLDRLVAKGVEEQVGRVLAERDQLREREDQQKAVLAGSQEFFRSVLGSNEQLEELKATALNTQLPQRQRDTAAAAYRAYESNRAFASRYQQGLMMVIQNQQADEDQKALSQFAQLQALDPAIVREGNRAKTLVHAYRVGMQAAEKALNKKYIEQFTKMKRRIETLQGSRSEERVRGGLTQTRRGTLATAHGRRANGRVARPDPMHGVLSNQRGIGRNSSTPFPTDDVLTRIKNGELLLRDIGLAG
jgi:hypothetical protein